MVILKNSLNIPKRPKPEGPIKRANALEDTILATILTTIEVELKTPILIKLFFSKFLIIGK